jgi:hypothetical protein
VQSDRIVVDHIGTAAAAVVVVVVVVVVAAVAMNLDHHILDERFVVAVVDILVVVVAMTRCSSDCSQSYPDRDWCSNYCSTTLSKKAIYLILFMNDCSSK